MKRFVLNYVSVHPVCKWIIVMMKIEGLFYVFYFHFQQMESSVVTRDCNKNKTFLHLVVTHFGFLVNSKMGGLVPL